MRSSAPIRLSRIMSEMRTVMIETISSVTRNTPPTTAPAATMSLGDVGLRERQQLASRSSSVTTAAAAQARDRQDLAHEAADHGEQGRDQHDAEQDDVEQRDGIGAQLGCWHAAVLRHRPARKSADRPASSKGDAVGLTRQSPCCFALRQLMRPRRRFRGPCIAAAPCRHPSRPQDVCRAPVAGGGDVGDQTGEAATSVSVRPRSAASARAASGTTARAKPSFAASFRRAAACATGRTAPDSEISPK